MHRCISNATDGQECDHINGDGLDNRRCNLRIVTRRQNTQNRHDERFSKYPGVVNSKNGFRAVINIKGKNKYLGSFKKTPKGEKKAFEAYKNAVHKLTGEKLICEL
jgi:hypothetical protein